MHTVRSKHKMYTVPPHDIDHDFWYIYQVTMKRFGWIFIGIHITLFFSNFFDAPQSRGGFEPEGILIIFYVVYGIALIIFDLMLILICLSSIQRIFTFFTINMNIMSYILISSTTVITSSILIILMSHPKSIDGRFGFTSVYTPLVLLFLFIVIFPVYKLKIPHRT